MGERPARLVDRDLVEDEDGEESRALLLRRPEADRADAPRRPRSSWRRSTSCCRSSSASRTRSRSSATPTPIWIAVAVAFNVLAFFSYVALFRGVVGERVLHLEWRESYQITMAGLAATRLFSAGGAGGIVLTYWALRKAGMPRRQTACRMVAFLVLLYAVYMLALMLFGILLRTGVLDGASPAGLTIVPAAIAGAVIAVFLLIALIPEDIERRLGGFAEGYRFGRCAQRLASGPADPGARHADGDRLRPRTRRAAGWRCWARSGSGRPTSASSGRRSTPTASRSRSGSSCRASSSAWSPTCSRSPRAGWGPWTRG